MELTVRQELESSDFERFVAAFDLDLESALGAV